PIVELERNTNGSMFSIRNFKRLYQSVSMNEKDALSKLFKASFELQLNGQSFKNLAHSRWNDFIASNALNKTDIDDFIGLLINNSVSSTQTVVQFPNFISNLVYQLRCSIVHNKETELHIASENYPLGCKLILEEYLLKFLEEIVFLLISDNNNIVWYESNALVLWDKSA
ncbi:hypothetical protein L4D08_25815, partial [Photobacterium chitinilyticum]|uniref:hypothetical protein n=1 Tax=Photobacterium chitinilyticum TaxID=2485123 RepID=UPI003D0E7C23